MAEQDPGQVWLRMLDAINNQMTSLTTSVGAQGVAKIVKTFDGSEPRDFKNWVKSVEKFVTLNRTPAEQTKLVAYQASQGPVSDFLKRYFEAHAGHNWEQVKAALRINFGEIVDSQHALLLLRKCKQKPGETVQVYAERLNSYAEDAFVDQPQGVREQQLVGYFVDGLKDDHLKMKVMRDNPDTFHNAITVATTEQNLRKRFQLRTGHALGSSHGQFSGQEPMEVDHMRPRVRCNFCHKFGHIVRDCRKRKKQMRVHATAVKYRSDIICYKCRGKGHIARECGKSKDEKSGSRTQHLN